MNNFGEKAAFIRQVAGLLRGPCRTALIPAAVAGKIDGREIWGQDQGESGR